jgi:hypothetical protein
MLLTQKHKIFTSFYHHDDQCYKNELDRKLGDTVINKSVKNGEYNSEDSDEYIKRLIRENKVSDSSVMIVLIGRNTRKRKHVDWEIYAALRGSIHGSSALIGVILPSLYYENDIDIFLPDRFKDNYESMYANIYTWDNFISRPNEIIDSAFRNKDSKKYLIDNSRLQMRYNKE